MGIRVQICAGWLLLLCIGAASTVRAQSPPGPATSTFASDPRRAAETDLRALIREEVQAELKSAGAGASSMLDLKSFFQNGFVSESGDGAFRFHFGGRFDYDNAWFTQDDNLLLGSDTAVRMQDGTAFRRLRLRTDGYVWHNIEFVTEVNFAAIQDIPNVNDEGVLVGSVGLSEVNLAFRNLPFGNLRVGFLTGPYGLERYTSANAWYYLERSAVYDAFFGPNDAQSGIQFFDAYLDQRLTVNASVTRVGKTNLAEFGFQAKDGQYAAGLRVTGLPIYDEEHTLVHLGANLFHQALADDQVAVANRIPLRAGAGPDEVPNTLRTGTFFTPDGATIADAEAAFVFGPFSLSAEYAVALRTDVFDQFRGGRFTGPRGNVTYWAAYVEGGYFITPGDRRRYDKLTGTWDRTVPVENALFVRDEDGRWGHGTGAIQLLARVSYIDLESGTPVLTPTSGGARAGIQRDVTLGVNWYLNPQTAVMVNYVWSHIDSVVPGASGDVNGIGIRLHFDF